MAETTWTITKTAKMREGEVQDVRNTKVGRVQWKIIRAGERMLKKLMTRKSLLL